ncbi:unnamed protein product [Clonostachys chloroleuca]|uniref:Uncharacterized protein n=1 Tax=Clonostachys chloroleuca TaxID=1926264 RepID=A0AA35LYM2_9HYPO|nr:unnamed protein product [Clonostachys chloroleuca]
MHLVKTIISLFALSGFAAAQIGGDFDAEYGLARREVQDARDGYLAARDEFLIAREEYIEKRGLLKKKGKCYKDGIQNLCGTPVKGGGMSTCGICPRGFEGKSCPCP